MTISWYCAGAAPTLMASSCSSSTRIFEHACSARRKLEGERPTATGQLPRDQPAEPLRQGSLVQQSSTDERDQIVQLARGERKRTPQQRIEGGEQRLDR